MSWLYGAIDDDVKGVDASLSMGERVHMRPSVGRGMTCRVPEYTSRSLDTL